MKLPGDSDKQQAVSHEMMQRSLQSQRRVVQRVGLLEDRVDQIESAEVEPGVDIGDLADGAKKIAKGIGKSIGKNAQLLGDKAGKAAQAAGKAALDATGKGIKSAADATGKGIKDAASATGKGIKKGIGKAGKGLTNVGKGLRDFIKDRAKVAKGIGKKSPVGKGGKDEADTSTGRSNVAPKPEPKQNLVPDPVAAMGVDPKTGEYLSKEERIRQFKERREMRAQGIDPDLPEAGDISKVDKLEDAGIGEDQVKNKVKKDLEDEFDIDPKMKKAFMDALALPVKSAAVAITDLLEKIPAPSREASKILNRNINKINDAFNLGAASTEVANDEADNDNKSKKGTVLGGIISKIFNLFTGNKSNSNVGGASDNGSGSGSNPRGITTITKGDATEGRRAPYTGTADGIGLGDGRVSRSNQNQTGKPRNSMTMNATTVFGGRGNTMSTGPSNFVELSSMNTHPLVSNSAAAYSSRTRTMSSGERYLELKAEREKQKRILNKEPVTNLTELTDKTIQENRVSADKKTQKQVATAVGTSDAITTPTIKPYQAEGGALAQPKIKKSKYVNAYNTTSQF